jgi:two-component system phosphate regulon response regulator PhoB
MLILMVTARGEESDVVLGLGVGADDYVVKPARPRELAARVKALLRRARLKDEVVTEKLLSHAGITVDPVRFEVRLAEGSPPADSETEAPAQAGASVVLTPTEFRMLQCLMNHPGRVYRRAELLDAAVGTGVFVDERNVDTHVKSLRKKLGTRGELIATVRGIGYRFQDE